MRIITHCIWVQCTQTIMLFSPIHPKKINTYFHPGVTQCNSVLFSVRHTPQHASVPKWPVTFICIPSLLRMSFATRRTCALFPFPGKRFWTLSREHWSRLVVQTQLWTAPSSWWLTSYRMPTTDTQPCTARWGMLECNLKMCNSAQWKAVSHWLGSFFKAVRAKDVLTQFSLSFSVVAVQSSELGGRLSGLLERYQQYQDEVVSLHSWLSTQEQNESIAKPSGDSDPQTLQKTLQQVQVRHT